MVVRYRACRSSTQSRSSVHGVKRLTIVRKGCLMPCMSMIVFRRTAIRSLRTTTPLRCGLISSKGACVIEERIGSPGLLVCVSILRGESLGAW